MFRWFGNFISFGAFTVLMLVTKSCFYYSEMTHLTAEEPTLNIQRNICKVMNKTGRKYASISPYSISANVTNS